MTTNSAELLPCPFCSGAANVEAVDRDDCWSVGCESCEFTLMNGEWNLGWHKSKEKAIAAWNNRRAAAQGEQSKEQHVCHNCLNTGIEKGVYENRTCGFCQAGSAEQVSEREAFEKHFGPKDGFAWRNEDGSYKVSALQSAWKVWQSACAWQCAALSAPERKVTDEDGRAEDQYLIDRFSKLLAGVAIALKGDELPLHRHSYHDLPEVAQVMRLERDLLRYQVEELQAALNQQGEQTAPEWQPIETAPKDAEILLLCPCVGVIRGRWQEDKYAKKPKPYWSNDLEHIFGKLSTRADQPTHWMHLPAAPSTAQKDGGKE